MTSNLSMLPISFFSNSPTLGQAIYGADFIGFISSGDSSILCWAALIRPRWPFLTDSNPDIIFINYVQYFAKLPDILTSFCQLIFFTLLVFPTHSCRRIFASHLSGRLYCMLLPVFSAAINLIDSLFKSFLEPLISFSSAFTSHLLAQICCNKRTACARVLICLLLIIWLFSLRAHNVVWSFIQVRNDHIFGEQNRLWRKACL